MTDAIMRAFFVFGWLVLMPVAGKLIAPLLNWRMK